MSELKAHNINVLSLHDIVNCELYIKSEADKVIAELKKEKEYVIENTTKVINARSVKSATKSTSGAWRWRSGVDLSALMLLITEYQEKSGNFTINGTNVGWNLQRNSGSLKIYFLY